MKKEIELFLNYGIYNNNLYFPNTFKKTKEYIEYLSPIIEDLSMIDEKELLSYISEKNINIYSLSICIAIMKLNEKNYSIISKKIQNHKELLIFLWIYKIINTNYRGKYINNLYIDKINIIENNIPELFNIYKPFYKTKKEINKKLKEKYKIKYMIESQEEFYNLLNKIKDFKITPSDINVEMGFTFDMKVKNDILKYFINNFDIVDLIYRIDKWFIEAIPIEVLEEIRIALDKLSDVSKVYELLIINTGLRHIELTNVINEQIKTLSSNDNDIKLNVNYMPNMKTNMKWDGIHTYNSYTSSILSVLNENFDSLICLKEKNISNPNTFDLYNLINNNTTFSLEKSSSIQKTDITSILFANDYAEGYDILWDVTNENCPLYENKGYLCVTGKNTFLVENILDYIIDLNNERDKLKKETKNQEKEEKKDIEKDKKEDEVCNSLKFNIRKN